MEDSLLDIDRSGSLPTADLVQTSRVLEPTVTQYQEHADNEKTGPRESRGRTRQARISIFLADEQPRELRNVEPGTVTGGAERGTGDPNGGVQASLAQDRKLGQTHWDPQRCLF